MYIKISQGIGIIKKLQHLLPIGSLINLYYSFCQSFVTYGLIVWGTAKSSQKTKLQKLMKKSIKIMLPRNMRNATINFHQTLNLLNLNQLLTMEVCKLAYDFHKRTILKPFINLFQYNSSIHSHLTRNNSDANSLHIPQNLPYNQVSYIGSTNWNYYCLDLTSLNNKNLFCKKLKAKLIAE